MNTADQPKQSERETAAAGENTEERADESTASQVSGTPFDSKLSAEAELEAELLPDATQLAVAAGAALISGALYLLMPVRLTPGPNWLPLVLEFLLLAPSLVAIFFLERHLPYKVARGLALALLGVLGLTLVGSTALLAQALITPGKSPLTGAEVLRSGALLWVVNILVFAVYYWEIDGEGPLSRLQAPYMPADLLFPQQQNGNPTHWVPGFIDYLFVAFCFSTALSPADTAPLTRPLKLFMMAQAAISLTIIVLLVGRSVNILS
jgi:hypothetical protein